MGIEWMIRKNEIRNIKNFRPKKKSSSEWFSPRDHFLELHKESEASWEEDN